MSLTKQQALEMFESDDLIGIGMEADAVRRKLHPEGTVTYIIDRNINYTNFCTEYCTFCAFYRPLKGPAAKEGYILDFDTIYEKIRETVELGGTGVLMQGGLHPDLKIDWHEKMLRGIKQRFPQVHLHCYSASEIIAIAEYSSLSIRDTIRRLRDAGLDSIPGGGAEILDDEVRYKIARLKCLTDDWLNVHRTAHQLGMRTTATMMFGVGENLRAPRQPLPGTLRSAGRNRRIHRLYPVELPAAEYRARRPPLGRSYRGRVSENAGHLAPLSLELPERAIELGDARTESLPDGPALRRQRRGLGDAGRKRGARRRRDQLHHRRRAAPHHPRCRLPSCAARHAVPAVLPELKQPATATRRKILKLFVIPNRAPSPVRNLLSRRAQRNAKTTKQTM